MAVSDDDIIKRRLLIEGDGAGDDKRINNLLKTFIKWYNIPDMDEEGNVLYQKMMAQIAQCEFTMEKSLLVYEMNLQEQKSYKKLNQEIGQNIKDAQEKILECKGELQQAKRIRKNRQEYDALAKVIQQHPDRQDTMRQLQALDKELDGQKETSKSLEQKLELRRKQFHVLVSAIHEMQRILDDDEKTENTEMETS